MSETYIMSETYTIIIPNIKDNDGDDVYLKIVFKKRYLHDCNFVEAEAFDSKGRYFYAEKLNKEIEYYVDKFKKNELNDVLYYDFYEYLSIFLENNKFGYGEFALEEKKDSPYHLLSINEKIQEKEKELIELQNKRIEIAKFYNDFNLI